MAAISNLLILLDAIELGLNVNSRVSALFRQAEAEGRNVSADELKAIGDENDLLHDQVMEKLKQ